MIPFVKAHACGNDFLILNDELCAAEPRDSLARRLCDRNRGVGADGAEFLEGRKQRSGSIRLYNADGSIAEISGNGTRCVAAWIGYETAARPGDEIVLETDAGVRVCRIASRGERSFDIASAMGIPRIEEMVLQLDGGRKIAGATVSIGNPHFVVMVEDRRFFVEGAPWQSLGEEICRHAAFPRQTNVEFVRMRSAGEIEIRIFERGVGPTASSGTGTCAAAAAAIHRRGANPALLVSSPGGTQAVHWPGGDSEMTLTGPAELICRGEAF